MEEKILKKMKRFVELSNRFSKSELDVFPVKNDNVFASNGTGTLTMGTSNGYTIGNYGDALVINGKSIYVDENNKVKAKDSKPLTRAEQILAEAEIKAKLSDEFDEYNKLRNELSTFLDAHENIIK
jgi:hypothetical protein